MPFLIVHESGSPPRLFEVRTSRITLGRAAGCELVLGNVSVSRQQALLTVDKEGEATVESLAAHNPVLVNDVAVEGAVSVEHGATLRLGTYKLTWLHESRLDGFRMMQLSEMPRFNRLGTEDANSTFALTGALHKKMLESELLRECGALAAVGGAVHSLGTGPVSVGPDDAVPCEARWGRRTAAVVEWAGGGHQIKLTGMFARVVVNGERVQEQLLRPEDQVTVNGTAFVYRVVRKRPR